MTEPPLFGPSAGPGPSAQGDLPPSESSPPMAPPDAETPVDAAAPADPLVPPTAPVPDMGSLTFPPAPGPADWNTFGAPPGAPPPGPTPAVVPGWSAPSAFNAAGATPPASGSRSAVAVVIAVVLALIVVGAIGAIAVMKSIGSTATPQAAAASVAASGPAASSVAASPPATSSTSGVVLFSDDFHDPGSGWSTDTLPSGTTYAYTDHGFVVVAKGNLNHISSAPYDVAQQSLTASMTASQSDRAPAGAGFGVSCDRGTGDAELRYEFVVYADGTWSIERKDGPISVGTSNVVTEGKLGADPGTAPMTVAGTCVSGSDGASTDLTLAVNGQNVTDMTDPTTTLAGDGWYAELVVASDDPPSTVTVTEFEVRSVP